MVNKKREVNSKLLKQKVASLLYSAWSIKDSGGEIKSVLDCSYLNYNAYTVIAYTGQSFCPAAKTVSTVGYGTLGYGRFIGFLKNNCENDENGIL